MVHGRQPVHRLQQGIERHVGRGPRRRVVLVRLVGVYPAVRHLTDEPRPREVRVDDARPDGVAAAAPRRDRRRGVLGAAQRDRLVVGAHVVQHLRRDLEHRARGVGVRLTRRYEDERRRGGSDQTAGEHGPTGARNDHLASWG